MQSLATIQSPSSAANGVAHLDIAAQINSHHDACQQSGSIALNHAMEVGRLLEQARRSCKHGEWGEWLNKNCKFAPRTAQQYVRLWKSREQIEQMRMDGAYLPITAARKQIAKPKAKKLSAGGIPDLSIAHVFAAIGTVAPGVGAVMQINRSDDPDYWHFEFWNLHTGATRTNMRPVSLEPAGDIDILELLMNIGMGDGEEQLPFTIQGTWRPFPVSDPVIPLVRDDVRRLAVKRFNSNRALASFAEQLELAEREIDCTPKGERDLATTE